MKKKILKICAILLGIIALVAASIILVKYLKNKHWEKEMNRSEAIAAKALDLLSSGDTATAKLVALCALPKNIDQRNSPYALEAEKVLRMTSFKDEIILIGHTDNVNSVEYSPDDKYIVSASDDKTVCLWNAEDYTLEKSFAGHQGRVQYATISSDGKYIVSYSNDDRSIIFWNISDGQIYKKIDLKSDIKGFCLSNSGHCIAYSTTENDIIIVDIDVDLQESKSLKGHESDVHLLRFNYNDKYLFSASLDNTFRIWNLDTVEEVDNVDTHYGKISSFFIDGNELLYLAINNNELMFTIGVIGMELKGGHTEKINFATFSPDKYCALSVSDDNSVIVWKLFDDKRFQLDVLMKYDGHSERVNHATFNHDGTHIASASDDFTVRVWEFRPLQELVEITKNEMGDRKLTPEELEKYGVE